MPTEAKQHECSYRGRTARAEMSSGKEQTERAGKSRNMHLTRQKLARPCRPSSKSKT